MSHRHGIQLPQQLRDEIEAKERQAGGPSQHRRKPALSRKEARRNERNGKKERKAQFFARPKDQPTSTAVTQQQKRPSDTEAAEQRPAKRQKTDKPAAEPLKPASAPERPRKEKTSTKHDTQNVDKPAATRESKPRQTALERLQAKLDDPAPSRRRKGKDEEDDKIAYLEAKLGLSKKAKNGAGGYASMFADDGLDDLLGDLDRIDYMDLDVSRLAAEESDDEDDESASISASSEEDDEASSDEAPEVEDASDDEEWGGIDAAEDVTQEGSESDDANGTGTQDAVEPQAPSSEPVSTIAPAGRYIPPALRKQQLAASAPSEEAVKLSRQLKGLLNRMSEQNIASVLVEFEDAYRKNSRHDVTSTLTTLIIDGIASHGTHLDAFVIIHAALVGALHRLIGVEFAAHFVQTAVERYDVAYTAAKSPDAASTEENNKQCANLLALISELYTLQVVACVLPYDIVRSLLDGPLDELDVELLLKLLRSSGPQMRSDDPLALKDIVQLVQDKVASEGEEVNSRTKFMIETLSSLKSGKAKRGADADGVGSRDVVERMKKFLGGLSKKRQVMAHEPLRVGLADLRDADKRGRWWLVGAAWAGDPLLERRQTIKPDDKPALINTEHGALLALARKHGMTTDVRRNIFIVLMSSEDCVDAANRLVALNLSDVQQREIVRVALHCLGAERSGYNPFWALVLQRTSSPSQKITLQFALWDFLREMGESKVGGSEVVKNSDNGGYEADGGVGDEKMENVARAYGWWIAKGACAITVLKPLEFQLLLPQTRKFLRRLFTHLVISTQTASPVTPASKITTRKREALERVILFAARVPVLQQGLLFFLASAFKKTASGAEGELVKWGVEVAKETLAAGVDLDALDEDE